MIKEIIEKATDETTLADITDELLEVDNKLDEYAAMISEKDAEIAKKDAEIANLKDSNFDLMKKVFDKKDPETKVTEEVDEKITDEFILNQMKGEE